MDDTSRAGRPPLLPERHPEADFFVCDFFGSAPKADIGSMEHPIFSLSTKPDLRARRYEHNGLFVEIAPSTHGLATIHDRDVLIYCISQLVAGLNEGREVSRIVRFKAHDLLRATNRMTNGQGYEALKAAFARLRGTTISTNIVTGGTEQFDVFGLIDRARILRETREGRMQEIEIELSEWVFNAIRAQEILTLHRDYFRLRKPLERRIYELARKHCGAKAEWRIRLDLLQKKCGSGSTPREFRRLLTNIVTEDRRHAHMPDYAVELEGDQVIFTGRGTVPPPAPADPGGWDGPLDARARAQAREAAPGWDVTRLERQWRAWLAENDVVPRRPEANFVAFCRAWAERRGAP